MRKNYKKRKIKTHFHKHNSHFIFKPEADKDFDPRKPSKNLYTRQLKHKYDHIFFFYKPQPFKVGLSCGTWKLGILSVILQCKRDHWHCLAIIYLKFFHMKTIAACMCTKQCLKYYEKLTYKFYNKNIKYAKVKPKVALNSDFVNAQSRAWGKNWH